MPWYTLVVGTAMAVITSAAAVSHDPPPAGVMTLDLHPTALLHREDEETGPRRMLTLEEMGDYQNAIYGPLQHPSSASEKEAFDQSRRVSRFERHAQSPSSRRLAATDSNVDLYQVTPLLQGYGTHYATVWVGTPPQRKSVIVDTGSHFTAFPCVGCKNCGEEHHTDKYFDPTLSSTFRRLHCDECHGMSRCHKAEGQEEERCVFSQSYTEGSSWSAYQARDRFFCGSNDVATGGSDPVDNSFAYPDFMFGCQTSETGLFVTQLADGIMGMSAHPTTLVKQMYDRDILLKNMFSMCFKRELQQEKGGVIAGLLTLGGIDTRLNTSPMVYAKNVAPNGWYTVNVKNIFLRKGGGMSAAIDLDNQDMIIKLPMKAKAVNSGKGVIIDSGTTDTYLSKALMTDFAASWKELTGAAYTNNALKLSKEEIEKFPTLIIQLEGWKFDEKQENDLMLGLQNAVGLAGPLGGDSPGDVLLAIPAAHFFEYSPSKDTYTSRLYFNESKGGVIGANAMQGHDVLFDWENGRVGFAESTCNYGDIKADLDLRLQKDGTGAPPGDEGHEKSVDCVLSEKRLVQTCADVVDITESCPNGADPETRVHGAHKKFEMVVERTGSGMHGKNCHQVAAETMEGMGAVTCNAGGTCTALVPCHISCQELMVEVKEEKEFTVVQQSGNNVKEGQCGDNTWGACTSWCEQSYVASFMMDDGNCHEDESQKLVRPCHIDACGSHDPCRVPFVVHAVIGLVGVSIDLWSKKEEEVFIDAFAENLGGLGGIGPGDVEVLMVNPWIPDEESVDQFLGVKMVLEVSIFNNTKVERSHTLPEDENNWGVVGKAFGKFEDKISQSEIIASCMEEDLYPLAKTALDLHNKLQAKPFMSKLIDGLPTREDDSTSLSFRGVHLPGASTRSEVISSWTILTHKGSIHDHTRDYTLMQSSNFTKERLKGYLSDLPFMATFFSSIVFLLAVGAYFGYKWEVRRGRHSLIAPIANKLKEMKNPTKGKYRQVGGSDIGDVEIT